MTARFKYIYQYAKRYRLQMFIILLTILITTYIVAMYPYIFGQLIDTLLYKNSISDFFRIVGVYCIIFIINQVLHFALDMTYANLQTKFIYDIKKNIFLKILSFTGEKLSSMQSGDMIYRINKDTDEVMLFIYSDIFYGLSALLDFIVCFGMIAFINLSFAGITLILAVITFMLSKFFRNRLAPINKTLAGLKASNESWLYEILGAMRDLKLLNAAKRSINKYMKHEIEILHINNRKLKEETTAERCNGAMSLISTLCIYIVSAYFIVSGKFTLGAMVACIDYFKRITLMLERLYTRTFTVSSRTVSIDRLMEIEQEPCEDDREDIPNRPIVSGDIEINNVDFAYNKEKPVLNQLSLHIKAGEKVSLVGKSGAGKSTIAELLCRLYDPVHGEIKIDGVSIRDYNLHDLRSQIVMVHQEAAIFHQSVRYNLIFHNEKSEDDKLWDVLKKAALDDVIRSLPDGLDTILNPSVMELSGGQKQRLVLARLYLKECKIIILDESTSALDEKTENDITKTWEQLFAAHTILIIAHRFSTIMKSDRVAYLDSGRIIGYDKHSELLKTCNEYYQLYMEHEMSNGRDMDIE